MNRNSLILLLGLALLLAGAVVYLRKDGEHQAIPSPFSSIDTSTVNRIEARRVDGGGFRLERLEGTWRVFAESEGERGARADVATVRRLLGFVADARPVDWLDATSENLANLGFEPPRLTVRISDAAHLTELEFGSPDVRDLTGVRVKGNATIHRVHAEIANAFAIDAASLEDPRIFDVPFTSVRKVVSRTDGGQPVELEKVGQRWFVRIAGNLVRAEHQLSEAFANVIVEMRANGKASAAELESLGNVEIYAEGKEPRARAMILAAKDGGLWVKFDEKDEPRPIDPAVRRHLERQASEYRDKILTGFVQPDLAEIVIGVPGQPPQLELVQRRTGWALRLHDGRLKSADQDRLRAFLDRFLNLPYQPLDPKGERPAPRLEARLKYGGATPLPDLVIGFAAPDATGKTLAWRSDEPTEGMLDAEAMRVVETRYWEVLLRSPVLGNDAQIDWIKITDQEGTVFEIQRDEQGIFRAKGDEVAYEFLQGLLSKMACLSVWDYAGPADAAARSGFSKPRWRVEWRHKKGRTTSAIGEPTGADYDLYDWVIGRNVDGSRYESEINDLPDLVFLIPGEELNAIVDAVRGIRSVAPNGTGK